MNKYDDKDYQIEREESIEYEEKSNIEEDEKIMKSLEYELDKIIIRSSKVETATEIVFLKQQYEYVYYNTKCLHIRGRSVLIELLFREL